MLRAHRQAWAWQDEYYGLTIEDIRRLERETQLALEEKMAAQQAAEDEDGTRSGRRSPLKLARRKSSSPRKSPSPPKSLLHKDDSNESFQSMVSQKTITDDTASGGVNKELIHTGYAHTHSRPSLSWCSTRSRLSGTMIWLFPMAGYQGVELQCIHNIANGQLLF
jgi:hypothetical protein